MAAGVEFGAMRATVTGALARVLGTALALWLPLIPLLFIVRRAVSGKTKTRCVPAAIPGPRPACTLQPACLACVRGGAVGERLQRFQNFSGACSEAGASSIR